jgi:hypothetical protein
VLHNNVYLDSTGVAILDAANQAWPGGPIQGGFSVLLQAGAELGSGGTRQADVSLVQSAVVPFGARSLWFLGRASSPNFTVSLGGANLDFLAFPMGGTTRYGADISGFAGQTLPLNFTVFAPGPHGQNNLYLDSIEFSSFSVPEPSTFELLALAGALDCFHFRRKQG